MDYQNFLGLIKNKKIPNILIFSGTEIGDKNEAFKEITKYHFENEKPQIYRFYCNNDFSKAEFTNCVNENELFSSKKIIVVKNLEEAKQQEIELFKNTLIPEKINIEKINNKKLLTDLTEFYEKTNDFLSLKKIKKEDFKKIATIFYKSDFSPISKDIFLIFFNDTNEQPPEQIINCLPDESHIFFYEMFDNKKYEWIKYEFNKYKLSINNDAISFLLDTVENNKYELQNVIQNIAIYNESIKSNIVSRDSIEDFIFHSKQETPFSLFSSMINKEFEKAINILNKLFLENPHQIIPGLIWSQRRLIKVLDLYYNMKIIESEIFQQLKITRKKAIDEMKKAIQNYSFKHSIYYYNKLVELEYFFRILPNDLKLAKIQEVIINYMNGYIGGSFLQGSPIFLQY